MYWCLEPAGSLELTAYLPYILLLSHLTLSLLVDMFAPDPHNNPPVAAAVETPRDPVCVPARQQHDALDAEDRKRCRAKPGPEAHQVQPDRSKLGYP